MNITLDAFVQKQIQVVLLKSLSNLAQSEDKQIYSIGDIIERARTDNDYFTFDPTKVPELLQIYVAEGIISRKKFVNPVGKRREGYIVGNNNNHLESVLKQLSWDLLFERQKLKQNYSNEAQQDIIKKLSYLGIAEKRIAKQLGISISHVYKFSDVDYETKQNDILILLQEDNLKEIFKRYEFQPTTFYDYCKKNQIEIPATITPYHHNSKLDLLIERGASMKEMEKALGLERDDLLRLIVGSGYFNQWKKQKDFVEEYKGRKGRKKMRSSFLEILESRLNYLLEESGIMRESLPSKHALKLKKKDLPSSKIKEAVYKGIELGLGARDVAYFLSLDLSKVIYHYQQAKKPTKPELIVEVSDFEGEKIYLPLWKVSLIYEAKDAEFSLREIQKLDNPHYKYIKQEIVYVLSSRESIEPALIDILRELYNKNDLVKPYKI